MTWSRYFSTYEEFDQASFRLLSIKKKPIPSDNVNKMIPKSNVLDNFSQMMLSKESKSAVLMFLHTILTRLWHIQA